MTAAEARQRWARWMMSRSTTEPPRYGSPEFLALPDGSPVKVAAVVRAAEAWARTGDDLERDLQAELDLSHRAFKVEEDAEYVERVTAHREQWRHLRTAGPLPAEQVVEPLEVIGRRYREERLANSDDACRDAS